MEKNGASFLTDIARGTGLLKVKVEGALWQLVACGLASGDGIAGLRTLLTPEQRRMPRRRLRILRGGRSIDRAMPVGRWSLWRRPLLSEDDRGQREERIARQLLSRYGVVFRDLLARESNLPPWRSLAQIFRRLEARGELRGGRFVSGFAGEQFALPQALEALRAVRRAPAKEEAIIVAAADTLNLVGILSPDPKVSPYSNQVIAYQRGVPMEIG
ncbi:MAG: hypothetical protein AB7T18_19875, partial [Alphaproteobacteria bacterium]